MYPREIGVLLRVEDAGAVAIVALMDAPLFGSRGSGRDEESYYDHRQLDKENRAVFRMARPRWDMAFSRRRSSRQSVCRFLWR